jgi:hypothetical protein
MREVNADNAGMGSEAAVQVVQACCLHCQQVRDYQPTGLEMPPLQNVSQTLSILLFSAPVITSADYPA